MILIVGLGNPGKEFKKTRHNIGFEIINEIQKELFFPSFIRKFNGVYSKKYVFNQEVILFKPMKFMNLSGNPTQQVFNFFNIENTDNLVVFHDDLDLEFPIIRCKTIGGHGGHNGIRNIIGIFGEKFNRIKVGIKNSFYNDNNIPADKFVLANFSDEELDKIKLLKKKITNNLELIVNKNFCSFKSKIWNGI